MSQTLKEGRCDCDCHMIGKCVVFLLVSEKDGLGKVVASIRIPVK